MGPAAKLDAQPEGGAAADQRAETVAKLPTFRDAFARRRAIVPARAFYKWKRREGQPKRPSVPLSVSRQAGTRWGYTPRSASSVSAGKVRSA